MSLDPSRPATPAGFGPARAGASLRANRRVSLGVLAVLAVASSLSVAALPTQRESAAHAAAVPAAPVGLLGSVVRG